MSKTKQPRQPTTFAGFHALAPFNDSESSFYLSFVISIIELKIRFRSEPNKIGMMNAKFDKELNDATYDPQISQAGNMIKQLITTVTTQAQNVEQGISWLNHYAENDPSVAEYLDAIMRKVFITIFSAKPHITDLIKHYQKLYEHYSIVLETLSSHYNVFINLCDQDGSVKLMKPKVYGKFPVFHLFQNNNNNSFAILYKEDQDDFDKNPSDPTLMQKLFFDAFPGPPKPDGPGVPIPGPPVPQIPGFLPNAPNPGPPRLGIPEPPRLGIPGPPRLGIPGPPMPGPPMPGFPMPGPPMPGFPMPGPPMPGPPMPGPPMPGPPVPGFSVPGFPMPGPPVPGLPVPGFPMPGPPIPRPPMPGPPMPGPPMPQIPGFPPNAPNPGMPKQPNPVMQRCLKCQKKKEYEEFTIIACPKKIGCNICSFCRKKYNQEQCPNCQRYYSDYEKSMFQFIYKDDQY